MAGYYPPLALFLTALSIPLLAESLHDHHGKQDGYHRRVPR